MADRKTGPAVDLIVRGDEANKREFSLEHAEALLQFEKDRGQKNWSLPAKSKYQFVNGKLVKGADTTTVRKTKKSGNDPEVHQAASED